MMSEWFYALADEQKGPINEAELKEYLAIGKLVPETLVWREGMEAWTAANVVPALAFRPPPAARSPSAEVLANQLEKREEAAGAISRPDPAEPLELAFLQTEKEKVYSLLAYLPFGWLVPLIMAPGSIFARFHTNQGLILFIFVAVLVVIGKIFSLLFNILLPHALLVPLNFILSFIYLPPLMLSIYGILNAVRGRCTPLPLIGGLRIVR